jgi:hypothetical protein
MKNYKHFISSEYKGTNLLYNHKEFGTFCSEPKIDLKVLRRKQLNNIEVLGIKYVISSILLDIAITSFAIYHQNSHRYLLLREDSIRISEALGMPDVVLHCPGCRGPRVDRKLHLVRAIREVYLVLGRDRLYPVDS